MRDWEGWKRNSPKYCLEQRTGSGNSKGGWARREWQLDGKHLDMLFQIPLAAKSGQAQKIRKQLLRVNTRFFLLLCTSSAENLWAGWDFEVSPCSFQVLAVSLGILLLAWPPSAPEPAADSLACKGERYSCILACKRLWISGAVSSLIVLQEDLHRSFKKVTGNS